MTLLLGAAEDRDTLEAVIAQFDVTIVSTIGRTALLVRTTESTVTERCELETVSSIERDRDDVE